ncbi:helicase HerA-like domain-containing protein, partial [Shinella sp.]
PPASRLGPITEAERKEIMGVSPVAGLYDEDFDRESAYEILMARAKKAADSAAAQEQAEQPAEQPSGGSRWTLPGFGDDEPAAPSAPKQAKPRAGYQRETVAEAAMKSVARTVASSLGRALVRGILGSLRR